MPLGQLFDGLQYNLINASLFCNKHAKKREAEKEFNQFIHVVLITFEA